ncbi:MAG: hypothetical protein ACLFVF_05345 [Thiohalospira sp.]
MGDGGGFWRRRRDDWHDLRHNRRRYHARRGRLRPPEGRSPLVWIRAGEGADNLRLAADLLGAVRQHRLDLRLVLTYPDEERAILRERLEGCSREKVALGYGPDPVARAERRAARRLAPLGLIEVGIPPSAALAAIPHRVAIRSRPADAAVEAALPAEAGTAEAWGERAEEVAPAADPLTLLAEAQMEPVLPALLGTERLAWFIGVRDWSGLEADWRAHPLAAEGILFASPAPGARVPSHLPRIADWDRSPLPPGTLMVVDDPRWNPALAVSAEAVHLFEDPPAARWQALAGHRPVTSAGPLPADAVGALPCPVVEGGAEAALDAWRGWLDDPLAARELGGACRRHFWAVRREADAAVNRLLERIYAW